MSGPRYDVVVVGAGPAGLSAAARARQRGLSYVLLERSEHLADTVHCYQARKHVMAEPGLIPLRSDLPFAAGSREAVLAGWQAAARDLGLDLRCRQELSGLERLEDGGFRLQTAAGESWECRKLVLALGTQGNPRRLGAPGEDLPHVATRLVDAASYTNQDVLVVGAGDSALEIALALSEENRVGLVVRTAEIVRAKETLAREAVKRDKTGQLTIHYGSVVKRLTAESAELETPEGPRTVAARHVFLKLGATPPRKLLEGWGVAFTGEGREGRPVLTEAYESTVPGLYLIGAVAGSDLIKLAANQGYEVIEHVLGNPIAPADEEILKSRLPTWVGTAAERLTSLTDEIPLFEAVDPRDLREVLLAAEVRSFRDGEVILRQNDYTDTFLVVTEGRVAITVRPEGGGAERRVATLSAGNFFGEMSLISGRRRNATATAEGPVSLIEIPRKAMVKLLHTQPALKKLVDQTFLVRAFERYLFPTTPELRLWELVGRSEALRIERDGMICREGDPGDAYYLIKSGMVKLTKSSGDRELVVSYLTAGNAFGEMALLDGARRTATVTAIFPSELVRLSKAECDVFLARYPEVRADLVARLEPQRIANLVSDATPRAGEVLHDLIQAEVVMGTDALLIDNHKCVRCGGCLRACEDVHEDGQARLSLTGIELANLLAPNSCWQCADPLCMLDCPPDAIVRNVRGEVFIKSNCIGCGNCANNCPYGNIFMVHPQEPVRGPFDWLKRLLGAKPAQVDREVAVKCDLCSSLPGGPACVRACPTGAAFRVDPGTYQQTIAGVVVARGEG